MNDRFLVTYATRYGATQEVAEAIAATLRASGLEVDLQPMQAVRSLDGYRGVVLGAPLYIGKWPKSALDFLARHQQALGARPVAVYALGPTGTDAEEMQGSRAQLDKVLAKYPWFTPIPLEMFVGRYDPARLSFAHKLLAALPASPLYQKPASDHRDWAAIQAWASELPARLGR